MTIMRLQFAGFIQKAEHKTAGAKSLVEMSICRKNYAKDGEEATFTWCKIVLWEPPSWMAPRLVKGAFIAGSGEMTLRSYAKSDGSKGVSCDVRCTSYDIECGTPRDAQTEPTPGMGQGRAPVSQPAAAIDDSAPPF